MEAAKPLLEAKEAEERTPQENPSPCLLVRHLRSKPLMRQVRIQLTPVQLSSNGGEERKRHWAQKRLFSNSEACLSEEPTAKKACDHHALGSQNSDGATFSGESPEHAAVTSEDSSSSSDSEDPENVKKDCEDGSPELSAYERKRLKNITENANFFASLKMFETAARLREITTKGKSCGKKRVKTPRSEPVTACRRSMRLQRVDPTGLPLPEPQAQPEPVEEYPRLPPGPLPMVPEDQEQGAEQTKGFLEMWAKISQVEPKKEERRTYTLESYQNSLSRMVLSGDSVAKVVRDRIYSVAIHPSESKTLVAAGDKRGQIGLWDLESGSEDGIHTFAAHSRPISCIYFSPSNPAHLLSLSHDGTIRCGDVTRATFEEVYRNEEYSLSSFDFLASDASTLLVGMWDGKVAVVDRRTPGNSLELSADLDSLTRTVHVHPVNRDYFVSAGARSVGIYDVRHLKTFGSKPVVSLAGHTKSVASAYFSPMTGNRVLTTCADDKLRIFGTKCLPSLAPALTTIRHNNNTGRWLTRFRAIWDPKRDDCFVVGSMSRPRQIEAFHANGELLQAFLSEDYLGSVCSINAWHPSRYILAGGNSSGRLHVFKE